MRLNISKSLSLPAAALTQTFAILGKRGSGKTTTASVFAEELLKEGLPLVIIDPTGAWWGLRSSKDGKSDGFPITILGGDHGDVPLEETAGKVIADLVAEEAPPLVLDLSALSKNAMRRFMIDFCERLYQKNRDAISVIIDEADMFAPQRIQKGGERLFGAVDEIVRRGRIRGLGVVMVSQRSAAINKDILSQCEVLIAHRANHPRDIEPVEEWMRIHATTKQIGEMHGSIAQLADGEAWVMSPEWLDFFGRVQIRDRETFNSSATPKAGERREGPKHLASVDLKALQKRMAQTIERARENDPEVLRRRIRELEKDRRGAGGTIKNLNTALLKQTDPLIIERAMEKGRQEVRRELGKKIGSLEQIVRQQQKRMADAASMLTGKKIEMPQGMGGTHAGAPHPARQTRTVPLPPPKREVAISDGEIKLKAGAMRMLAAAVKWNPRGITAIQMKTLAGIKHANTDSTYRTQLLSGGFLIEERGLYFPTQAGIDRVGGDIETPETTREVMETWLPFFKDGARRMLKYLVYDLKGEFTAHEDLMRASGIEHPNTYSTYKTQLKSAHLVIEEDGQIAANKETLFL